MDHQVHHSDWIGIETHGHDSRGAPIKIPNFTQKATETYKPLLQLCNLDAQLNYKFSMILLTFGNNSFVAEWIMKQLAAHGFDAKQFETMTLS